MKPKSISYLVLLVILSTGCSEDRRSDPSKLSVWITHNDEEREVFEEVCRDFEKGHLAETGQTVQIETYRVPFDGLLPKLRTVAASRRAPDICRVDVAHVVPMAYGQAILPLNEIDGFPAASVEAARKTYVPAAVDSCLFALPGEEPKLWGVPEQTNTVVLFYNRAHFRGKAERLRQLGCDPERAPRTWEEFSRYCEALTDPETGRYGFAMELKLWWSMAFLNTFAAPFVQFSETTGFRCALSDPTTIQALEYMVSLYQDPITVNGIKTRREAGAWQSGAVQKDQGFMNGQYSMIFTGPWRLKTFEDAGLDFGVSTIPEGPAGSSSNVGGQNMVVFRSCPNPPLALKFLLYLGSRPVQIKWASRLGQIPVRPDVFDLVDVTKQPRLRTFFDQMLTARARPTIPRYDRLEEIVNVEIEQAVKGEKSVKSALEDACQRVDHEMFGDHQTSP